MKKQIDIKNCDQCGACCRRCKKSFWKQTNEKENVLLQALIKYKQEKRNTECLMLGFDGEKSVCILQMVFGKEGKPDICKEYTCK